MITTVENAPLSSRFATCSMGCPPSAVGSPIARAWTSETTGGLNLRCPCLSVMATSLDNGPRRLTCRVSRRPQVGATEDDLEDALRGSYAHTLAVPVLTFAATREEPGDYIISSIRPVKVTPLGEEQAQAARLHIWAWACLVWRAYSAESNICAKHSAFCSRYESK